MTFPFRTRSGRSLRLLFSAAFVAGILLTLRPCPLDAGVTTEYGFEIPGQPIELMSLTNRNRLGDPVPVYQYLMVDDGMRRYYMGRRLVPREQVVSESRLVTTEVFNLPNRGRQIGNTPAIVGQFVSTEPFDENGRRTVQLQTSGGTEDVIQAITRITPETVRIESTTHVWSYEMDTKRLPPDTLHQLISRTIDPADPDARMSVALFYVQAEMFSAARSELERIGNDFPELKDRVEEQRAELTRLNALLALNELKQRRAAGQHRFAYEFARVFPSDRITANVDAQARQIVREYETAMEHRDRITVLLAELEAKLPDEEAEPLRPLRSILLDELHFDNLSRLDPFLQLADDDSVPPADRLAIAYSGWVLGPENVVTSLPEAVRLWEVRFAAEAYLRAADEYQRRLALDAFANAEGATPERLASILQLIPPPVETPAAQPMTPLDVEVTKNSAGAPVRYTVILPPEYSPHHRYPVMIALHGKGGSTEGEARWWAGTSDQPGQAARHGYIVLAPQYLPSDAPDYIGQSAAHDAILQSLYDARRRFRIDSDRIFIAGHGEGGEVAFDVGMSRPYLFAGAIPIGAPCLRHCNFYWKNAKELSWYAIAGERDRNVFERSASVLERMMQKGYDGIYCEYKGRGYETYFDELPRVFEWMSLHRRPDPPRELDLEILRPSDNRWAWLEVGGFPPGSFPPVDWTSPTPRASTLTIRANITVGNTVHVSTAAQSATVRLSPDLINFDERVTVRFNGRTRSRSLITPSAAEMLAGFGQTGDRERLTWAKLELK